MNGPQLLSSILNSKKCFFISDRFLQCFALKIYQQIQLTMYLLLLASLSIKSTK